MKIQLFFIAAVLPLTLSAQSTTLFNETWSADRKTYVAPDENGNGSAQWFSVANGSTVTYTSGGSGSIREANGGSARSLLAYIAPAGSPLTIAAGHTLTATFDVKFGANTSTTGGFRFSLLDSTNVTQINNGETGLGTVHNNNRVINDNFGNTTPFTGLAGYGVLMNPGVGTGDNGLRFIERNDTMTAGSVMTTSVGQIGSVGSGVDTTASVEIGEIYTGVLSITRTDSGFDLIYGFSGPGGINYSISANDSTPSTYSFDTVGFLQSIASGGYEILSLKLDYGLAPAPVPEPSTYAMLAGLATLGFVVLRRRAARRG